jgi:hypothetical protein
MLTGFPRQQQAVQLCECVETSTTAVSVLKRCRIHAWALPINDRLLAWVTVLGWLQLYMTQGHRGQYDEKILVFPSAPIFSREGCAFLKMLTKVTSKRLKYSLWEPSEDISRWDLFRLRAPDAGRIMWAMGKIKWRDKRVFKLAGQLCRDDLLCPWNRPRYMTTAMWGAAWALPSMPILSLAKALERAPPSFWKGAACTAFLTGV